MKNVIITGSSSGFSLKAAKDFVDKGNRVYATMRNPKGCMSTNSIRVRVLF